MYRPRPSRPLAALAAGLAGAGALAVATTAGATEGPAAPPPPSWGMTPPALLPGPTAPAASRRSRPVIRGARIVPRHVRRGKRAVLRLSLSDDGRVRITITRRSRPHRGRVTVKQVTARAGKVAIRLPRGVHGRALATGRYRVSVVVAGATGRSRTVHRSFAVRAAHG